jgi:hypothetical protein
MTYNNKSLDITLAQLAFGDTEPTDLHIFFNIEKNTFKIFSYDQDRFACKNGIFSIEYPLPGNMSPITCIENLTKNKKDVYIFFVNMYHTKLLETLE